MPDLPELTANQLAILGEFLWMNATPEDIRVVLRGVFDFDLGLTSRTATNMFKTPVPGVLVTREHLENALDRKRRGIISEGALARWATIILLNPAYEIDPQDEDLIAQWLNDISYELDPS